MHPFTLKYQPKTLEDVHGQNTPLTKLQNFIQNHKEQKKKSALIYGPIGCGKTSSIYALAKNLNLETIEINSSDLRNEKAINSVIGSALQQRSLFFQGKIVLIDEIDNFSGRKDRGGTNALNKLIQKSTYPVILTANEPHDKKLAPLRKSSELIEFNKLKYTTISNVLKKICEKEQIQYEEKAINTLSRIADGDLRGALIDLQLLACDGKLSFDKLDQLSDRKKTDNIFNALQLIFKASSVENSLHALNNLDIPINEVFLWLDENLPKEYTAPEDLYNAYQKLSKADVFNGRIRRQQHWRFLVYISNFLTAGISSSKSQKNPSFIQYSRTKRILKLWQAKMKNAKKKDLASKISQKTHSSQRQTIQNMPYFKVIFKNSDKEAQNQFSEQFDLSDDEIGWLNK
ncbi:replication factor C large subunit [Nanoarchaeota archaeon]